MYSLCRLASFSPSRVIHSFLYSYDGVPAPYNSISGSFHLSHRRVHPLTTQPPPSFASFFPSSISFRSFFFLPFFTLFPVIFFFSLFSYPFFYPLSLSLSRSLFLALALLLVQTETCSVYPKERHSFDFYRAFGTYKREIYARNLLF